MDIENEQEISLEPTESVLQLQNIMTARATHSSDHQDDMLYVSLRKTLIGDAGIRQRLPRAVRVCHNLEQFWQFIRQRYSTYAERRDYLQREFEPLLSYLEGLPSNPVDDLLGDILKDFSAEAVQNVWSKALERRKSDPGAAITSARSLIESVCKHILEEAGEKCSNPDQLYQQTVAWMNLAPNQQSEQSFKQLLGSCNSIVGSLYAIRNRFGDAHGRGSFDTSPSPRHAELAVNVAGSLTVFLVRTYFEEEHPRP